MSNLTTLQQTQLIQLAVGMFNIAPGSVLLGELGDYIAGGGQTDATSLVLAEFDTFGGSEFYSPDLTPQEFADTFLDNLLGDAVTAADRDYVASVIVQMLDEAPPDQQEQVRALVMGGVINALAGFRATDPHWGEAALQFSNRVLVARAYSVDYAGALTDTALLHDVIASVTDSPLSVVMSLDAIDAAIASSDTAEVTSPTVDATLTAYGGDGADTLVGSGGPDILIGGAGADVITGSAGADILGIDVIYGGTGDDVIVGAEKHDSIDGGSGNDTLKLDSTNVLDSGYTQPIDALLQSVETIDLSGDTMITVDLTGQTEKFIVNIAGAEGHIVTGGSGNDSITGGSGNDTIQGGGGKDIINGVTGDDAIMGVSPGSAIDGGAGNDTLQLSSDNVSGNTYTQADDTKLTGVELIEVSGDVSLKVNLTGQTDNLTFSLSGGEGHNVTSGSGKDIFLGARDIDTINGGAGADTLMLDSSNSDGGSYAPPQNNSLSGVEIISISDDSPVALDLQNQTEGFAIGLTGANGHDVISGAGADTIAGSDGDDSITSGSGKDSITGGLGNDQINLNETVAARDKLIYGDATEFGDTITGFKAGIQSTSDQIQLAPAMFDGLGNSSSTAIVVSTLSNNSKLFTLNSTVILCPNIIVAIDAATTDVAAELAGYGANAKYASGDKLIFGVGDVDGNTRLYYFVSDGAQDSIIDTELTLVLTFVGVAAKDFSAINFSQ